jgi:Transposase DDE domain
MPYKANEPRRHKIPRARYRVTNWPDYDRALQRRGSLTVWVTPEALAAWHPPGTGRRGRSRHYSDIAIETGHLLRLAFGRPWRQTEGLLRSLTALPGVDVGVPDHTTLCGRPGRGNGVGVLSLAASLAASSFLVGQAWPRRGEDPVRCALMSGLSRGGCRWPPWVCACVPGTNLSAARSRRNVVCGTAWTASIGSLSHHAVQRFPPDQPGSRPASTVPRGAVTPQPALSPGDVRSGGRPPCASSPPRRCAPSCSPAPRSPA